MVVELAERNNKSKGKIILLLLLFIPCFLITKAIDNDLWFLLNSGRYVLENGIPYIEPFTMHNNMSFVMQQWLSAIIFWLVYSNFGFFGFFSFLFIIYGVIIWITYRLCMRITDDNFTISYAITFFSTALVRFFITQRPHVFTLLIVALEIYCLESYIASGRRRYLLVLPVLSILEINLHAAMWPIMFVILVPYVIDSFKFRLLFIEGEGYPQKAFFICIAAMLIAGFVNPYGFEAMTYLVRYYGYSEISSYVAEMKPVDINSSLGKLIYGVMLLVVFVYCFYRKGVSRLRYILLSLGMTYLSLSSIRNFMFFGYCVIIPMSYYLKGVSVPVSLERPSRRIFVLRTGLIITLLVVTLFCGYSNYCDASADSEKPKSAAAIEFLLEYTHHQSVELYTGYNDGSYAEFMGLKPYLDPRAEVFVKQNNKNFDIMKEYAMMRTGQLYYKNVLDKYGFRYLLVDTKKDILYTYLPYDADYMVIYEDDRYHVYEKIK